MMKRFALTLLLAASPWVDAAEPVLREDFASYAEGEQPLLPPDDNEHTWRFDEGWSAGVYREDGRAFVQVRRPGGLPYATFGRGFKRVARERKLTMRLHLRIPAGAEPSDYFLILGNHGSNAHGGAVKIRVHGYRISVYDGPENAVKMMPETLTPGAWYTLRVEANYPAQEYSVTLARESDSMVIYDSGPLRFTMESPPFDNFLVRPQESREPALGALEWDIADLLIETES